MDTQKNINDKVENYDEFNFYFTIKNIWQNKYKIVILTMIFAIISIIYSLSVNHLYKVKATIKPADANDETSLSDVSPMMGFSLGGYVNTPVTNQILLTLKSDTFLEIIYKKYEKEEKLFDDYLKEIDQTNDSKEYKSELKRYKAMKILHEVIKYSVNSDHNIINFTIELKDKYFAYELMNFLLTTLKNYIRKQNINNLQEDIVFYKELITETADPMVIQMIEKKLSEKIEKKFALSSNVFMIIDKPFVPAKRSYPHRSFMVIMTTFIGFLFSVFIISVKPVLLKIYDIVKE